MVMFDFRVNRSFVIYGTHPLTVPKSIVPHTAMREHGIDRGEITVVYPRGERMLAHMYYGHTKQRGWYYQIRHYADSAIFPAYLKQGQKLLVILLRDKDQTYAILEFQDLS